MATTGEAGPLLASNKVRLVELLGHQIALLGVRRRVLQLVPISLQTFFFSSPHPNLILPLRRFHYLLSDKESEK